MNWLLYLAIVIGVLTRDLIVRVIDNSTAPAPYKVLMLALTIILLLVVAVLVSGRVHIG